MNSSATEKVFILAWLGAIYSLLVLIPTYQSFNETTVQLAVPVDYDRFYAENDEAVTISTSPVENHPAKYINTAKVAPGWSGAWPSTRELPANQRRDTACPVTRVKNKNRVKRWPDIIGVGFPKCGTGTLAFLDCHDDIVFREAEGMLWHKYDEETCSPSLRKYAVPNASNDEVLIEKTPQIISGNYSQLLGRAKCIKKINPNVKILAMICDPVKRFISHAKHVIGYNANATARDVKTVTMVKNDVKWMLQRNGDMTHLTSPTAVKFAESPFKTERHMRFLRYGNYHQQLLPFLEVFGTDGVIIMDGSNMGNVEVAYLEQRLSLAHQLEFEFNAKKKFNCLASPLEYCLSDAKGRPSTIDKRAKLKLEIEILQEYFKPQMVALFKLLYPQLSPSEFCEGQNQRFQWLSPYICHLL